VNFQRFFSGRNCRKNRYFPSGLCKMGERCDRPGYRNAGNHGCPHFIL